jgi:hypothetical protein
MGLNFDSPQATHLLASAPIGGASDPLSASGLADLYGMPTATNTAANTASISASGLNAPGDLSLGASVGSSSSGFSFVSSSAASAVSPGAATMGMGMAPMHHAPMQPMAAARTPAVAAAGSGGSSAFSFVKSSKSTDPFSFVSATVASAKK